MILKAGLIFICALKGQVFIRLYVLNSLLDPDPVIFLAILNIMTF